MRYDEFNLDQCHTVATALGYAAKKLCSEIQEHLREGYIRSTVEYQKRCLWDIEDEIELLNQRISTLQSENAPPQ